MTTTHYNAWRHIAHLVGVENVFASEFGRDTDEAMRTVRLALATFLKKNRIEGEIEPQEQLHHGTWMVEIQVLVPPEIDYSYYQRTDPEPDLFWHFAIVDLEPYAWIKLIEDFNKWVDTRTNRS